MLRIKPTESIVASMVVLLGTHQTVFAESSTSEQSLSEAWEFIEQSIDSLLVDEKSTQQPVVFPLRLSPKAIGRWKDRRAWVDSLFIDVDHDGKNEWVVQTRDSIFGLKLLDGDFVKFFDQTFSGGLRKQRSQIPNGLITPKEYRTVSFSFDHSERYETFSVDSGMGTKQFSDAKSLDYCGVSDLTIQVGRPYWLLPNLGREKNLVKSVVKLNCYKESEYDLLFFVANGNELWGDCRLSHLNCKEGETYGRLLDSVGHAFAVGDTNNDGVVEIYVTNNSMPTGRDRVTCWEMGALGLKKNDSFSFREGIQDVVIGDVDNNQTQNVLVVVGNTDNKQIWKLN